MAKMVTTSDVFDINKRTGALILGKNRLDDYATKFLNKYCRQALVEPMSLPVDDILADAKLTVKRYLFLLIWMYLVVAYYWMDMLMFIAKKKKDIFLLFSRKEQFLSIHLLVRY